MKRRWILAGVVVACAAALLPAGAATGGPKPLQRSTPRQIEAIAMDGARVAYDVAGGVSDNGRTYNCNSVYAWNLVSGTVTRVSGKATCAADTTSTGTGVRELALAGSRVGWIVNTGGDSESDDYLYTASLPRPKEHRLALAVRSGPVDPVVVGDWIGGLVGAGKFLGVNRWTTDAQGNVSVARLHAIQARLRTIASGPQTMKAGSTDGKQIAVLRADGSVGLYSTAGRLLRVVMPASAREVAVRGDYLAVLTKADTLAVYNSHSGKLLHTWRVAKGATYLDVSSGMAAYAAWRFANGWRLRTVHVLSLATGKDRIVVLTKAKGRIPPPAIAGVQLEPIGLVYATNRATSTGRVGLLAFKPMKQLR